jgi:hypothetical protein
MNLSGAGHSKKNMLLADLYMFDTFKKKKTVLEMYYSISYWLSAGRIAVFRVREGKNIV